jgi:sulfur carrier protein
MPSIILNGVTSTIDTNLSLLDAIAQWKLTPNTFAIAIDGTFVPKANYESTIISEGNSIEIVTAMQGG